MIELRTFDGSAEELAHFCNRVWKQKYAKTDMAVPLWTPEFFEWELLRETPEEREFLVAAYDGTQLVGVLPCRPIPCLLQGEPTFVTFGSYFSVDPAYETAGVAMKLNLEQIRRHRQRGAKFLMGFVYLGSSAAQGKEFWLRQPRTMNVIAKLGHSIRILDHKIVGRFERSLSHKLGLRLLGTFQRIPKVEPTENVRPYHAADLPACLALAEELSARADFSVVWDQQSLQRQLSYGLISHTFVALEEGRVQGFLNYHPMELVRSDAHGTDSITAGMIDLVHVNHLSLKAARQLFYVVLRHMQQKGCHLARLLRVKDGPGQLLTRTGFIKNPADHYFTAQEMLPGSKIPEGIEKLHVPFR